MSTHCLLPPAISPSNKRCTFISKGISTEEIIAIEYVLLPDTPEEKEDIPHEEWVSAVAVLPSIDRASWVLSGSYDKCARVWGESGELLALLPGHDEPITGAAWAAPRSAQVVGMDRRVYCSC